MQQQMQQQATVSANNALQAQMASQAAATEAALQQRTAQEAAAANLAAANAAGAMEAVNAYQVETVQSEPVNTQETAAVSKKKKPNKSLKISPNSQATSAGTGLNIGV